LEGRKVDQAKLTEVELQVVVAVAKGYSDGEIADLLKMGEATVKKILGRVCEKFDIQTRLVLKFWAIEYCQALEWLCCNCEKPFKEHSPEEIRACAALQQEPNVLLPCSVCGRPFKEHSREQRLECLEKDY
jgi:DNA-binding CsgD family transcriptional regulator